MRQFGDFGMPKDGDAVFIHNSALDMRGMPISLFGVFKTLPGALVCGLMILFLMGLRGQTMRMSGRVVQFGSSLMILVMRSVVITRRHA